MSGFNWAQSAQAFADFGGAEKNLYVPKTGLPFFDTLRLYGAIELFVGLQQEVYISDQGSVWQVKAKVREHLLKDLGDVIKVLQKGKMGRREEACQAQLGAALERQIEWPLEPKRNVSTPLDNPDSALKDGIRDIAASTYKGLETGFGKKSKVPLADAILAYAGQERTETVAGIYFLPVFEGKVDFSKVVCPLRAWVGIPNVLCAQALTLLALKAALFAEGYDEKLSAVAYNTNLDGRTFYNYSGIIRIESTALASKRNVKADFVSHFYRTFRALVGRAWVREGRGYKATGETEDALAHAYWLMQPSSHKHLSSLITAVERQKLHGKPNIIGEPNTQEHLRKSYVKEIFCMSYGNWSGDHEAVRKFARAVASGIYHSRQADETDYKKRGKVWYDEVVMLRSAPTPKAFFERAMILIEQGKRKHQFIGSTGNDEDFDPSSLFQSVGKDRAAFETFRDLFRMYLVQESTPRSKNEPGLAVPPPDTTQKISGGVKE